MAAAGAATEGPIIIKKYANRRLYNTSSSSYITLDDLSRMTREGIDFQVLDAKTGNEITHSILTQIIMEEESSREEQMLPISFLRQLISMYGNSMQSMMPSYLEAAMENFRLNQRKLQESFTAGAGTDAFAKLAETNLAMFEAATKAFMTPAMRNMNGTAAPPPPPPPPSPAEPAPSSSGELEALKAQMAAMQKKLDELGR